MHTVHFAVCTLQCNADFKFSKKRECTQSIRLIKVINSTFSSISPAPASAKRATVLYALWSKTENKKYLPTSKHTENHKNLFLCRNGTLYFILQCTIGVRVIDTIEYLICRVEMRPCHNEAVLATHCDSAL